MVGHCATQLRGDLEKARSDARENEALASKAQLELASLAQKVEALTQQKVELEKDRMKVGETHREVLRALKDAMEAERISLGRGKEEEKENEVDTVDDGSTYPHYPSSRISNTAHSPVYIASCPRTYVSVDLLNIQIWSRHGKEQ